MRTLIYCLTRLCARQVYQVLYTNIILHVLLRLHLRSLLRGGDRFCFRSLCVGDVTDAEVGVNILKAAGTSL